MTDSSPEGEHFRGQGQQNFEPGAATNALTRFPEMRRDSIGRTIQPSSLVVGLCAVIAFVMAACPGFAVSFNCSKASNSVESWICSTPALSILDDRLAVAYAAARESSPNVSQLIAC
jgi:hypothetical protein